MRVAHGLYQQTVVRITEQDGRTQFSSLRSTASRESRHSPPERESVWHAKQLWANSGRILVAKNAASESGLRGMPRRPEPGPLVRPHDTAPRHPDSTSIRLGALIAGAVVRQINGSLNFGSLF